jgi:hypothetical protein
MLRTIWGDNERYLSTYWEKFQNRYYVAGDSARRDKDGYYWIMGRIDDVLNVAGHRLGTMEIESALVAHPLVAESAVVGQPHEIKGESVFAYVVLNVQRPEGTAAKSLIEELRAWVGEQLSPIAKPDEIRLTDNLPKTRSGKIMRRLLRSIARGEEITQDMSTLENPGILEQLRGGSEAPTTVERAAPAKRAAPPKSAAPVKRATPAKQAAAAERNAPAKQVVPAKKAVQPRRAAASKKPAVRPKAKQADKRARPGKVVKKPRGAKKSKGAKKPAIAAKRGKQTARMTGAKRKAVTAMSRRAAVKSAHRKPRGKK